MGDWSVDGSRVSVGSGRGCCPEGGDDAGPSPSGTLYYQFFIFTDSTGQVGRHGLLASSVHVGLTAYPWLSTGRVYRGRRSRGLPVTSGTGSRTFVQASSKRLGPTHDPYLDDPTPVCPGPEIGVPGTSDPLKCSCTYFISLVLSILDNILIFVSRNPSQCSFHGPLGLSLPKKSDPPLIPCKCSQSLLDPGLSTFP